MANAVKRATQLTYSDAQMCKPQLRVGGSVSGWVGEWMGRSMADASEIGCL